MKYGYAVTNITLNEKDYCVCLRLDENRKLTGVNLSLKHSKVILNNIYVGRVEKKVPNIKAYFVRFSDSGDGNKYNCFLPYDEASDPFYVKKNSKKEELCVGDEILIQITREALKEKEPAATCHLSLQGKYLVLNTKDNKLTFSKKISQSRKDELIEAFLPYQDDFLDYNVIVRTIAASKDINAVISDYIALKEQYHTLMQTYMHKSLYSIVYKEPPAFINYLKNQFAEQPEFITTDSIEIYEEIKNQLFVDLAEENINSILKYYDNQAVSLNVLYNIYSNIKELLSKKVWLKSGSNIIIEQLETLTFIDVNSAKTDIKKSNALSVNKEAAYAALEQISLRNISGMILIDFINMNEEDTIELITYLKEISNKFPEPCKYIDITKLGLVELTRKKVSKSIKEICEDFS